VNGILQERHLPGFLPTSPVYDSFNEQVIMELDFDESKWDEEHHHYIINE
jgi:hypothetical protein